MLYHDTLSIDNKKVNIAAGDALGVFVKNNNTAQYECVGYTNMTGSVDTINAYAPDSNGFNGSAYRILYWNNQNKCQTIMEISNSQALQINNTLTFTLLKGSTTNIYYYGTLFQINSGSIVPNNPDTIPVFFSSNVGMNQFALDSISGIINTNASIAGSYNVFVKTDYCLLQDSINITLVSADTAQKAPLSFHVTVTNPSCTNSGMVLVKIVGDTTKKIVEIDLLNTTSGITYSDASGGFYNLPEGLYSLSALDDSSKRYNHPSLILLSRSEDCHNPIISPDSKTGLQSIYIKEQGTGKILDNEGKTVKDIQLPGEWYGEDNKGNPVPMGDYYLFIDGHQNKVITVIR